MSSGKERMDLIFRRTEEIRKEQTRKKKLWMQTGCMAACLVLVISLGVCMPGWMEQAVSGSVAHTSGAASLIANQPQLGYIVMGIVSFCLGCAATVLLYRIKGRNQQESVQENKQECAQEKLEKEQESGQESERKREQIRERESGKNS